MDMPPEALMLGPCCVCGKMNDTSIRNLLMLDRKAPVPGTGWGCLVCNLPLDGAVALVCDECLEANRPLLQVIYGRPSDGKRIAVGDFPKEPFQHNMDFHQDETPPETWHEDEQSTCWNCGGPMVYEVCATCDGKGWIGPSNDCPDCDQNGGWWACRRCDIAEH